MSKIYLITLEELLERYADGQRDFTRFTIRYTDQDFENGIDLSGAKFRGYSLEDLIYALQNSNLSGADLRSIQFRRANLDRCNLSGAKLNKATLWRAGLYRANLSGANLNGASLQEACFARANLRGANLSRTWLCETHFDVADLSGANFTNARIHRRISFNEANLTQVNFTGLLLDVGWDKIDFTEAYFQDTIMPDGSVCSS